MKTTFLIPLLAAGLFCTPTAHTAHPEDLILYEVFPRNHSRKGTLKAIYKSLDKIEQLGVNTLWLMPIHPVGFEERKGTMGSPYAIKDYFTVNPELGTMHDLESLIQATHKKNMKIILDFVPNHCAWDNAYVVEHTEWFKQDEQGNVLPPNPDWNDVVQFKHEHPEVRQELEAILSHWLDIGIDGFRVDVAGMVPAEVWESIIPQLRAAHPDLIMLAEATGSPYHHQGFDLSYDEHLRNILWKVSNGLEPAHTITEHLEEVTTTYKPGSKLLRYIENHDISRAASSFPAGLDRAAATLIFTLPGAPLIYAGQEVGIQKKPNLFEKDPVHWENGSTEVENFYQRLIKLRNEHPVFRNGTMSTLRNTHPEQVVSYTVKNRTHQAVVIINFSNESILQFWVNDPIRDFHGQQPQFGSRAVTGNLRTLEAGDYFVWINKN